MCPPNAPNLTFFIMSLTLRVRAGLMPRQELPTNESIPAYPMMFESGGVTDLSSTANAVGIMRNGVVLYRCVTSCKRSESSEQELCPFWSPTWRQHSFITLSFAVLLGDTCRGIPVPQCLQVSCVLRLYHHNTLFQLITP